MSKPITPTKAREAAKLTARELAQRVPCALATVYTVERANDWPRHRALRSSYLRAVGLCEIDGKITKAGTGS